MLQGSNPHHNFEDSRISPQMRNGANQSIRYHHSNSSRPVQAMASSHYRSSANPLINNRSSNFSLNKGSVAVAASRKLYKSPKNLITKPAKPHSILDLLANKSPLRAISRSPDRQDNPLFLKELQSARNNHNHSFSSARNRNTTGMRSQRTNNLSELRNVRQTQIVPTMHAVDSTELDQFVQRTPNKLNDSQLQNKLFRPRRSRPVKLNLKAQGVEQKLRNLLTAHKASDQETEVINETRQTRENRKSEMRHATQPSEDRIQYSQRLKWKSYLFDLVGYSYVKELGRGGYARVILCRHEQTNQLYAVKIYDKLLLESRSKISNIKRQLSIMKTICGHQNISSLRESIENKTTTFIVMQYCMGHSLFAEIKGSNIQRIPEYRAKSIFRQIVEAVIHLKRNKIAHRDIKAENILVNGPTVKLIDFGFSVFCQRYELIETFCGTPTYMAPEIVSREPYDPFKSDVWSLGVLLYLMLHGIYPFFSQDQKVLFSRIEKGKYKLGEFLSQDARQLIKWMLMIKPEERISVEDIPRLNWL